MAYVDVSLHNSDKKNLEMILQSSYIAFWWVVVKFPISVT